jgi:general secretion pathway protein F
VPIFDYKGVAASGKNEKGTVEAENLKAARLKLKKQRILVTQITEKTAATQARSGGIPFIGNRIGLAEVTNFTRQLASLVRANIPLVEALTATMEQSEKEKVKFVIEQVRSAVNEGSSFARALAQHPKVFDNIYINMVEAGESSGTLGVVLVKLADLKEAQTRLRAKVVSGATYPVLMMGFSIILVLGIFAFVIPKLTKIFVSMGKEMPLQTKILMWISDVILNYWFILGPVAFVSYLLFRSYIKSARGLPRWDRFKLTAPVVGKLTRMIALTRFSSTMGTLLTSGVPILSSMAIARNLVGNVHIANAIETARTNITEGQSIADPLKRSGEFPPLVIHMISIGEKTGELPNMLQNIAENYEEQVNVQIERMTGLLEPIMIIGMGLFVGVVVMSIFMPLMEITNIK